jgi:hypothetical protein
MKLFLSLILSLCVTIVAIGQKVLHDSADQKESFAVAELGGFAGCNIKGGGLNLGPTIAVEITPIENWLELELGVTPSFGSYTRQWDIDFLFKKPWALSQKVEFMFGLGLLWTRLSEFNATTNSLAGEAALDFMFWPTLRHRFGWYLEPEFDYDFRQGHEQSLGISAGLLIGIP